MRTALVTIIYDKAGLANFIVYFKNDESKFRIIEYNKFKKLDDNISYSTPPSIVTNNLKRIHLVINETSTLYYDCFIYKRVAQVIEMGGRGILLFKHLKEKLQDVLNKIKDK